jgi:hypothetical protein
MNDSSPLTLAREAFQQNYPWWTFYLVRDLENSRVGLAFRWALDCTEQLLPLYASPHTSALAADLAQLRLWFEANLDVSNIIELAREIWYRPGRDVAQTAISHLYGAYRMWAINVPNYMHLVGYPIVNFTDAQLSSPDWAEYVFQLVVEKSLRLKG